MDLRIWVVHRSEIVERVWFVSLVRVPFQGFTPTNKADTISEEVKDVSFNHHLAGCVQLLFIGLAAPALGIIYLHKVGYDLRSIVEIVVDHLVEPYAVSFVW